MTTPSDITWLKSTCLIPSLSSSIITNTMEEVSSKGQGQRGNPHRGTWRKVTNTQLGFFISDKLTISNNYTNRKVCQIFDYITYSSLANSAAGIMRFHHLPTCDIIPLLREDVISVIGLWNLFSRIKIAFALDYIFSWWFDLDGCYGKTLMTAFHFVINTGLVTRLRYPVSSWRQKAPVTAGLRYGKRCIWECYSFALTHIPRGLG